MLTVILLAFAVIAAAVLAMAAGTLLSGRCLRGSCGGPEALDADGESLTCATCPRRRERPDSTDRLAGRQPVQQGQARPGEPDPRAGVRVLPR